MEEEFETAKAWVEKYEFCRFEGERNENKLKTDVWGEVSSKYS